MPFVKHVAVMPDVHAGKGSTVGTVFATEKVLIPAAVGVDIGCGMMASKTSVKGADITGLLRELRSEIESAVPHGGPGPSGYWKETPEIVATNFAELVGNWKREGLPEFLLSGPVERQLGTLGGGNHFIEVCLDEDDNVWLMLHSGSRGVGNKIGTYYTEKAKEEMERWHIHLPDSDLAYLPEGSFHYSKYVEAVSWAQNFANTNRHIMMLYVLGAFKQFMTKNGFEGTAVVGNIVSCHHNYVEMENHFGKNVWVTRKGAVRAREKDYGIIPGSMGAKSFIVKGRGNPHSLDSCSHGAGRLMSRTEARKRFTLEDHDRDTALVECRKDAGVLDETPKAYKDIEKVMASQTDLVDIVATLRQIVCVKG
jgi:tRNA-splicing ligase RtcB